MKKWIEEGLKVELIEEVKSIESCGCESKKSCRRREEVEGFVVKNL